MAEFFGALSGLALLSLAAGAVMAVIGVGWAPDTYPVLATVKDTTALSWHGHFGTFAWQWAAMTAGYALIASAIVALRG